VGGFWGGRKMRGWHVGELGYGNREINRSEEIKNWISDERRGDM
jgi:hypothetical protein